MAQYKRCTVELIAKMSAASGSAMDKQAYPTHTEIYTESYEVPSIKWATENIVAPMMGILVASAQTPFVDELTGVRVRVAYTIRAKAGNSVSATGVSREEGETQVSRGKKLSKNARRKLARYGKKPAK